VRAWIIGSGRETFVAAGSAVLNEADGDVDAFLPAPALLLDPDLVEHGFELRLQVWRGFGL
jgi:hypothetical protein